MSLKTIINLVAFFSRYKVTLGMYIYKLCIKDCYVRGQEDGPLGKSMCPASLITRVQIWNT